MTDAFAADWIDAWNRHDLAAILSHYAADVVFTSPFAVRLTGDGTVRDEEALRAYFAAALRRYPQLEFRLIDVLTCVDTVTLYYWGAGEKVVAEVLTVGPDHRISRVLAHYSVGADFSA